MNEKIIIKTSLNSQQETTFKVMIETIEISCYAPIIKEIVDKADIFDDVKRHFEVRDNMVWVIAFFDHYPSDVEIFKVKDDRIKEGERLVKDIKALNTKLKIIDNLRKDNIL